MDLIFWLTLFLIIYTYIGYPCVIAMLKRFNSIRICKCAVYPSVSVIIAAYNEERIIIHRLQNLMTLEYPHELLEIIVVSDGSTDKTVEYAKAVAPENVSVYALGKNVGKALALNYAVTKAKGEIIVFTDARQSFHPDAIGNLVANFSDDSVGCVSGELHFLKDPTSNIETQMGAYWKYEKFIRRCESASGSVVGATGCIYSIRRELFQSLPPGTILDDVLIPLFIAQKGKRILFEAQAIAYDIISKNTDQEWRRKVRTLAGNWQLISLAPWILTPWENPLWFRYVSHKLLRLLVPFGMIILLVASLLAYNIYHFFTVSQFIFYLIALIAYLLPSTRKFRLVNFIHFFMVMNIAALVGFWKWISGGCDTAWQPAYAEADKMQNL